ncbi:MAG: outer membrane beta-barrel protein [Flavobacteriia bacterium]
MKKHILFALILFGTTSLFAQSVEKGSILITPYAGFPNLTKVLLKSIDRVYETEVDSKGPFGIKADYLFNEKISFGINFIYNSASISGKVDSLTNDIIDTTYNIKINMNRFRFHANAKYHFFIGEKFDSYVGLGFGLNARRYTIDTDYPNFDKQGLFATLIPISGRFDVGANFFLAKNIGLNLELGIGGPVIVTGIFVKIP